MKFFLYSLCLFLCFFLLISCGGDGGSAQDEPINDSIGEPECLVSQDCKVGYECKDTKCIAIEIPEEIIPDEPDEDFVDEEPDLDIFEGCREHTDCAADEICYESECVSPFEVNWLVSKISTSVSEDKDWDLSPDCLIASCRPPDLYVSVLINDEKVFETEEEQNSYSADFSANTLLELKKTDKLSFQVVDNDINTGFADDVIAEFYIDPPVPTWFFREGFIDVDCEDLDNVESFKLSFQPLK